ncbi:Protein of unknown function [Gryllus bimaculatus]|nr:Protein of unknown function [Gryllus bimaculatus]
MELSNSTNDMNRIELPKLKKAFVSLQKLDMLTQMPVSEDGSENSKVHTDALEESEDPSSESVSMGSAESNVVCTDDDDLEKKIQAFSIPVKKDAEKSSSKSDIESVKIHSEKGAVIEKGREGIKSGKKQISKPDNKTKQKSVLKMDTRTPPNAATSNSIIVSRGIRKKKEGMVKQKVKTDNEKKPQTAVPLSVKGQELNADSAKASEVNTLINKSSLDHSLRNGRGDKQSEKNNERKDKKEESEDVVESASGSEVSRKRKAIKDENSQIRAKKVLIERKNSKLPNEPTFSEQNKEKTKRIIDVKLRSDSIKKKKIIPSKDPPKLSDRNPLHMKRSARMSGSDNRAKYIEKDLEKKTLRSKTQSKTIEVVSKKLQKSKIEVKKRHSSSRERSGITSKLKTKDGKAVENKIKEKASEKSIDIGVGKTDHSVPKEATKDLEKLSSIRKDSKRINRGLEKENSNSKTISETKSDDLGKKIQKSSEVFDDGEELLEKICDLLEEASGVPESESEENRIGTQKLYLRHQGTIFHSNEGRLLIPDAYFFKPRIVHKNSRFPSQGKGTVSYKKLWKWSHYVKMPSDMWSLHKHPDGSFVIVFHISELSPFPKLMIDKCIIFKETAAPHVKIFGKEVLALSSDKELKTLGNVCSFLKQIHDISLCEGMLSPLRGGSNNNCELYTNAKVSLPYKCKSCL